MKRGFLLGKFLPPHAGHLFLCETASKLVDELTILVCSLDREPIPGALRFEWMRELMPRARLIHLTDDVPQEPSDHPDFWNIWRGLCREAHPEPVDLVFGSEPYVVHLAEELGASPVVVDPDRDAFSVSGTAIRNAPQKNWNYIPGPVRPYYQTRVVLFGPESVGKTTLSRRLADRFDTLWVPEYGRSFDRFRGEAEWTADDFAVIAQRQTAMRRSLAPRAGPLLFEDTDPLLTSVWQQMLLGSEPNWMNDVPLADHYLLLTDDAAWTDDGTRYFGDPATRSKFMALCEETLIKRNARHTKISGDWIEREVAAVAALAQYT